MSKIEVDAIDKQSGSTLTIGGSGTAVTLACGATQSGFGRSGSVNWQTSIKTANFTATSGEGYFCDTASVGAFTLTLPSSPSVGDIVALKDYASNFATANLTIGRGGSNLNGDATDSVRNTDNESLTLVYADATKGWLAVEEGTGFIGEAFISASGGTETTSGNCKIHTFTGPGTFTVNKVAADAVNNVVSYVVVAGGGGGGGSLGNSANGGGGAGGFRETKSPVTPYTASPLDGYGTPTNRITVTATSFPITVGAGGTAGGAPAPQPTPGGAGGQSVFSTITSAGGGGGSGVGPSPYPAANSGGSGGGSVYGNSGGVGNTPSVTPPQGSNGGTGTISASSYGGGGGGGAGGVGGNASPPIGGTGGNGVGTAINTAVGTSGPCGSLKYFSGGGAGGTCGSSRASGGFGGGADGGAAVPALTSPVSLMNGTDNTGGGAGGSAQQGGGTGGSGIVIIRYKIS